jgi:hypothetical protein
MGAFGSFGNPQPEKKAGFGSMRGESRFKGLMGKTSIEDFDKAAPKEKASLSNLGKLSEAEPRATTRILSRTTICLQVAQRCMAVTTLAHRDGKA